MLKKHKPIFFFTIIFLHEILDFSLIFNIISAYIKPLIISCDQLLYPHPHRNLQPAVLTTASTLFWHCHCRCSADHQVASLSGGTSGSNLALEQGKTQDVIASYVWEQRQYPPYSHGLAPSDYHLFRYLKRTLAVSGTTAMTTSKRWWFSG